MSKRTPRRSARKPPQQARSRATVSIILDAMTRVLEREGDAAATTTRVAEVAGISIGTLYQYFSDRDAILDALQDREFERATELMQQALAAGIHESPRSTARSVVQGLQQLYAAAPGLHRLLAVEGLRVTPTERVQAFDRRIIDVIRRFLAVAHIPLRRTNVEGAAFVAYHSVRATMLARLLEAPPSLDDAMVVEEVTDLLLRYLIDEQSLPATGA